MQDGRTDGRTDEHRNGESGPREGWLRRFWSWWVAEEPPDAGIGFTGWFFALLYGGGFLWLLGSTAARAWTGLVHAVVSEEVKVPTTDPWWSTDSGLACSALDGVAYPWDTGDLLVVYADTGFDEGLWALADAPATVDAVTAVGGNLWVVDMSGKITSGTAVSACRWASLSAVDDVIERRRTPGTDPDLQTMAFISVSKTETLGTLQPCQAREVAERLREEADRHDGAGHPILVGVLVDEPWRELDGPDTFLWQPAGDCGDGRSTRTYSHWSPDDLDAFADLFRTGAYAGPASDDAPCTSDTGAPPAGCDTGTATLGGANLEFWVRMLDAAMPRYVLPSLVLGVPGELGGSGTTCGTAWSFCASDGDYAWAQWTSSGPLLNAWPTWARRVVLDLYVAVAMHHPPLELAVSVNGTPVQGRMYDDATEAWPAVSDSLSTTTVYQVVKRRYCIGGPECSGATPWLDGYAATNTIDLEVSPTTSTAVNTDRLVYVWGAKVKYYGPAQDPVWEDPLEPSEATTGFEGSAGDTGGGALAGTNAAWRITSSLDGVAIAMNNRFGIAESVSDTGLSVSPPQVTYAGAHSYYDFVVDACAWLDTQGVDCTVEVAGAGYDDEALPYDPVTLNGVDYPRAPLWLWRWRLDAGEYPGDGTMALDLPLHFAAAGTEAGRWAWRAAAACPGTGCTMGADDRVRVYELPEAHMVAGSREEYQVVLDTGDPACDGWWYVDVDVSAPVRYPVLHWWVARETATAREIKGHGPAWSTTEHDDVDFRAIHGDILRLFWRSRGGGMGPAALSKVAFSVTPPDTGCPYTWRHTSGVDTGFPRWDTGGVPAWTVHEYHPTPMQLYDCVVGFWAGDPGACP